VALLIATGQPTTWGADGQAPVADRPAGAGPMPERATAVDDEAALAAANRNALIERLKPLGVNCGGDRAAGRLRVTVARADATDATVMMLEPLKDNIRTIHLVQGNFTEACLDTIVQFKALRQLTISSAPAISESGMKKIASLPKLYHIYLDQCAQLTDAALRQLEDCPALDTLLLKGRADQITDEGLARLASFPSLGTLFITSDSITDDGLRRLAESKSLCVLSLGGQGFGASGLRQLKSARRLEDLRLVGCPQIDDDALAAIGELTQLRSLSIEGGTMTDQGLVHLKGLVHLGSLSLTGDGITGAGLEPLTGTVRLGSLTVLGENVSNEVFAHAGRFPRLSILTVGAGKSTDSPQVTDAGLALLARAQYLGWLHLKGTAITDHGLESLESLPRFQMVYSWSSPASPTWRVWRNRTAAERQAAGPAPQDDRRQVLDKLQRRGVVCREGIDNHQFVRAGPQARNGRFEVEIKNPRVGDKAVAIVPRLAGVVQLSLDGPQFTDASLDAIANLPDLECLTLRGATISAAGVEKLTMLPRLRTLALHDCAITDEELQILQRCQALQNLTLDGRNNHVTWAGFEQLAASTSLLLLRVENFATDEGLQGLAKSKSLSELTLAGMAISERALQGIANVENLSALGLSDAEVTPAALRRLKSAARLTNLDITRCPHLDDDALAAIGELSQLHHLTLTGDTITDDGLAHLNRLFDLNSLTLSSSHITGAGLGSLTALARLNHLMLHGKNVSNDTFAHLSQFPKLNYLYLDGSGADHFRINDEGLKLIGKVPNLQTIFFVSTGITDEGVITLSELSRLHNVSFRDSPGITRPDWQF
jgi:Leucine-rich repeat (LRR) protein